MTTQPIICFGQQPCGFLPKRFLVAKIETARKLQAEIGGEIVFFYHDSDHDPRETRTILPHRKTGEPAQLNFTYDNKLQRKFVPVYLKRVAAGWREKTISQLTNYVDHPLIDIFKSVNEPIQSEFCLEMYRKMGLLDGIRIVRSSDPELRERATNITNGEFFVDVPFQDEIVRARYSNDKFVLHEGGNAFIEVPMQDYTKRQVSPARDSRLVWMQSIIGCTHYIAGMGERQYLDTTQTPSITFITRQEIDRSDAAYTIL